MSQPFDFVAELRAALGDAYEVERELTGSGMSRVFVATERSLNRRVVIKVLPPELAAGVNRDRFRREIQLAAQLQHPHIVPLHTAGAHGDLLYFTMPYIEGESLRHALHEGVRFSPREAVRILHDVSDALAYAHERGVIHRDIKPGNVLRSGSHAVVTDFGVAKAISAALPAVGMTTSGMAIGTPAYMAPEQLAGDPAADHRVDIYALGLLGYELLTGEAPFQSSSPQETMAAQLTRVPEPISNRRPDAPPALAALLSRCLAKNPADRPQTAAEVTRQLEEIELSSGSAVPRRAPARVRLGIALGLGAAAVATVLVWRGRDAPPSDGPPDSVALAAAAPAESLPTLPPRATTLTREDSLAIAQAINRKVSEQQAAVRAKAESEAVPPAAGATRSGAAAAADLSVQVTRMAESLRVEIERAVLDSVSRLRTGVPDVRTLLRTYGLDSMVLLNRGRQPLPSAADRVPRPLSVPHATGLSPADFAARAANMGPPRRVFVSYPALGTRYAYLAPAVDSLVQRLRDGVSRDPRFLVIPESTVRQALVRTRTMSSISRALDVELFTSVNAHVMPDSTVVWQVTSRDLGAHPAYHVRSTASKGLRSAPLAGVDSLVAETVRFLRDMDRVPRRAPEGSDRRRP
jgi:serine/threonine-protein kinase